MDSQDNNIKTQVVTLRRSRVCNVCKKRIANKTKAILWHWVASDDAYTHVKCFTPDKQLSNESEKD